MSQVEDSELLHRRVHPDQVKEDGQLSSAAFHDEQLSVDRARLRGIAETMAGFPRHGAVAVLTGLARSLEQEVVADPVAITDGPELIWNHAHALVIGHKPRSIRLRLARASSWVIPVSRS
jgi:hypothetical protein